MMKQAPEFASVRLTRSIKAQVKQMAVGEKRSLSLMLRILIEEALIERERRKAEK